jgi:hypothetical protein
MAWLLIENRDNFAVSFHYFSSLYHAMELLTVYFIMELFDDVR